jgi:hypothetical protein
MIVRIAPMISVVFGVLIFFFPKFLNYLVAIYLVLTGLIGLGVIALR